MTYLHLLNCLSLTFGAPVITYRCTNLPDYNAYPSLVSCFFIYAFSAIVKLFLLSNLPNFIIESYYYDEVFKILFGIVLTPFAILQCFSRVSGLSRMPVNSRILCVGLGFTFAHSLTHYLIPLWGAKQLEFDWQYIHLALRSNLYLFLYIAITAVLFNCKEKYDSLSMNSNDEKMVQGSNKKGGNSKGKSNNNNNKKGGKKNGSKDGNDSNDDKDGSNSGSGGSGVSLFFKNTFYYLTDMSLVVILVGALGFESISFIVSNLLGFSTFMAFLFELSVTCGVVYMSYLIVGNKLFKVE